MNVREFQETCRKLGLSEKDIQELTNKALNSKCIVEACASERPARKTFCQLPKGHLGSHQAIIYWEDT